MAPFATTFEFAVFVNGVEQPGTRFVIALPDALSTANQTQLKGTCHINCDDLDLVTIQNVGGGAFALSALSSSLGTPNVASVTIKRLGDSPVIA